MFDNFILRLNAVEKKVSIGRIRYVEPKEEANRNLLYAVSIFLLSIGSVLGVLVNARILLVCTFFLFLIVFLLEAYLWNFALCPEKKPIKLNVYINRIMYVGLIVVLNITACGIIETDQTIYSFAFLNIIIFINGFIIKYKTHHIKMNNGEPLFQDAVSDWEKKNIEEIAGSVTYIGVGLIAASFVYGGSGFGIARLFIKVMLFSIGYYSINNKMLKIKNEKYMQNIKSIDISLVIGLIFNVACLFAASHYKVEIINNYQNICDSIIAASFLSLFPIINQYKKMSAFVKKIRYTQNINNEEL